MANQLTLQKHLKVLNILYTGESKCEICDSNMPDHEWAVLDSNGFVHACSISKKVPIFVTVVFLSDSEATEPLRILNEKGENEAINYLLYWYESQAERRVQPSYGESDTVYIQGCYILSYNLNLNYICLEYVMDI